MVVPGGQIRGHRETTEIRKSTTFRLPFRYKENRTLSKTSRSILTESRSFFRPGMCSCCNHCASSGESDPTSREESRTGGLDVEGWKLDIASCIFCRRICSC
jgi:formate hydrogenlyase subunit 6/NADH:ubiquinone oxidoreductase subunit I